jgi:serine/threonine protein kinase
MKQINHPNIMHLFDFMESSNNYYLVMQYCNKGDIEHYLSKQPKNWLPEKEALYFLKQIMNGFQVLRKHQVMHRDFKLANIFLNDETLVIGDFGFARAGQEMARTNLGTPLTKAPELHNGAVDSLKIRVLTPPKLICGQLV